MTRSILPRRSIRRLVTMEVECRTQTGLRDKGEISDISAEGCCLHMQGIYFRVGTRVIVRPRGLEGMSGVVRWVSGDVAGIEFDRPLYPPVVDHLEREHGLAANAEAAVSYPVSRGSRGVGLSGMGGSRS